MGAKESEIVLKELCPLWLNRKPYCPFCGKEMEEHEYCLDHYDFYTYYTCKCNDFKRYGEEMEKIEKLYYNLPKPKFTIKTVTELAEI